METLNRAFLYGESVFTTLRMVEGNLCDWDMHFERLRLGVEYVFGPFSDEENWVPLLKNRLEACSQHESGDKVIRYTIYRPQARGLRRTGLISVSDLKINFHATPYDPARIEGRGLRLRTCPLIPRPYWWPAYLKSGSYLETILAQKVYLKEDDDDLLFLTKDDTLLESSVANIFVVRHNKLYTAPTGPNVLDGVMRRKVIAMADDFFDEVEETETTMEQAMKADAIFGSNSVRGLFLIKAIDDHDFEYAKEFLEKFEILRERVLR